MQVRKLKLKRPKISLLRVAAYARVSHDAIGMRNSFESQINHYANYIQKHKSWEYVGVYADYARTGTKVSARPEFQRLMADCDEGKIDLVLCKSVSRFGRNTVELLHNIRHLRDLNIEVRFEEEGISTVSPSCELILTMISAVAENEIRDMSSNIKWAINKKFKEGKLNGIPLINGYKWDSGILVIDEERAEIVKRIFNMIIEGYSYKGIAGVLNDEGIPSRTGKMWSDNTIKKLINNSIFTGDLLLQKTFISDPISKKVQKNNGEFPKYWVEENHEPIISKETFDTVQEVIKQRPGRPVYAFTGILECGICGKKYGRVTKGRYVYWSCTGRFRTRECLESRTLREDELIKLSREILDVNLNEPEEPEEREEQNEPEENLKEERAFEELFTERVQSAEVHSDSLIFHMKNGDLIRKELSKYKNRGSVESSETATETGTETATETASEPASTSTSAPPSASKQERPSRYPFSEKLECGHCGRHYQRAKRSGRRKVRWVCSGKTAHSACPDSKSITEEELIQISTGVLKTFDEETFRKSIKKIIVEDERLNYCMEDGINHVVKRVKNN